MPTFAQLCARADARIDRGEPVALGAICQQLMLELETTMPDPLTNGTETVVEFDTVEQTAADLPPEPPFRSLDELRAAAAEALAAVMAHAATGRPPGPAMLSEATQLVDVALDWGQTAFVLLRAGSDEDAYTLAKAVRAIDGDIEPVPGDLLEAHRVISRIIDGSRASAN